MPPFDIKQNGRGYNVKEIGNKWSIYRGKVFHFDDYGNYNFGVAAKAFGLSLEVAKKVAGIAQILSDGGYSNSLGGLGDWESDTKIIIQGYNHEFK